MLLPNTKIAVADAQAKTSNITTTIVNALLHRSTQNNPKRAILVRAFAVKTNHTTLSQGEPPMQF
jgi:hypothetical protein